MSQQYPPPEEPSGSVPPPGSGPYGSPPPQNPYGSAPPPAENPYGSAPPPAENPYGQAPPPQNPYGQAPPPQNPYGTAPAYGGVVPGGPVTRPRSMDLAVLLMRVGAGLSLLSLLTVFFMQDELRDAVQTSLEDTGQQVDPTLVDATVTIGIAVGVLFGLIGAGLWLFMAWANGKGKSWARITATALFGISLLFFLVGLLQPAGAVSRVLSIVNIVLGGTIVFLLWKQESSRFYAASSAPRY